MYNSQGQGQIESTNCNTNSIITTVQNISKKNERTVIKKLGYRKEKT